MAIVERIQNEHRDIRRRLAVFDKSLVGLTTGRLVGGLGLVAGLGTFIQAAVLPHLGLEEKAVFPQLATGSPEEKDLAKQLLADHLALRDYFVNYVVEAGKGKVTEEFVALARDMSTRLASHSQREDAELVPVLRSWMGLSGASRRVGTSGAAAEPKPEVAQQQETSALSEMVQLLSRSHLFSRLTGVELSSLAAVGRWREYPAGEVIAREGQQATMVATLDRGTVAVVRTIQAWAGAMTFTSSMVTSGDVVGWSGLVEPYRYNATAQCLVPVRCLEMDGAALRRLLAGSPATQSKVMYNLVMMMRGRLNETMEALVKNL